jgi:H+-translocating NAD(P) transhydrogenase subunit alpha
MRIAVPRENAQDEARIALVPETVKRLVAKKFDVSVETGAGAGARISDDELKAAGATIESSAKELYDVADLVVRVNVPTRDEVLMMKDGSALFSLLYPLVNTELVRALAEKKMTVLAADMIPRTTLAQMMDVLSSQATIAGYRAVLSAAHALPKLFPMLMTAAGTIAPAKVLVLGAGVAGLQAIATSRRLGAVVEAFDVRKVVKEQVESLGAKFIEVPSDEDGQTAGGYAKEVSDEYKKKQAELVAKHAAKSDCVITTALIPGRRAPILLTADQVKGMRDGSVVVDLAAEQGGNCELTKPGETIKVGGVTIIGERNLPSKMSVHASQMYSRNMEKLLLYVTKDAALAWVADDEIVRGALIVKDGDIVHPQVKELLAGAIGAGAAAASAGGAVASAAGAVAVAKEGA